MTNLWLRLESKNPKELWFLDYDEGLAKRIENSPPGESIRKWKGSILEFLEQKEIKIINESEGQIKFQPFKI